MLELMRWSGIFFKFVRNGWIFQWNLATSVNGLCRAFCAVLHCFGCWWVADLCVFHVSVILEMWQRWNLTFGHHSAVRVVAVVGGQIVQVSAYRTEENTCFISTESTAITGPLTVLLLKRNRQLQPPDWHQVETIRWKKPAILDSYSNDLHRLTAFKSAKSQLKLVSRRAGYFLTRTPRRFLKLDQNYRLFCI